MHTVFRRTLLPAAVILVLALSLHAPGFVVTDADGYYHLRHAWVYATEGPLAHAFPWVQASAIRAEAADLWYGFHLLLVPLTWLTDPAQAIRVGAFGVTGGALGLAFLALRRLGAAMPLGWTALLAVASADLAFRLTMLRPHALSLGAVLWLFALLHAPEPADRRGSPAWLPAFLVAGLLAWMHLALAWVAVVVLVAAALATAVLTRAMPAWRPACGLLGGLVAGWLARPRPLGAARLAWIQVVEFQRAKARGAIQVGHELLPLDLPLFVSQLAPLALAAAGTATLLLASRPRRTHPAPSAATWSALALSAAFLTLGFASARRATEFFVGFTVLFLARAWSDLARADAPVRRRAAAPAWNRRSVTTAALAILVAFCALRALPVVREYRRLVSFHFAPERFRQTGAWLAEHAAGQVAFNAHWDRFAQLFCWNPRTYYINGMDPIFEYAVSPRLHGIHHLLSVDAIETFVTPEGRRRAGIDKDLRTLLAEDFGARWIVTEGQRTPRLVQYLSSAPEFERAFAAGDELVFRIRR